MACGCNRNKGFKPQNTAKKAAGPKITASGNKVSMQKTVKAQASEPVKNTNITAERRAKEKQRREIILKRMGR